MLLSVHSCIRVQHVIDLGCYFPENKIPFIIARKPLKKVWGIEGVLYRAVYI